MPDAEEQGFFSEWLSDIADWVTPDAYSDIVSDPSADNFRYFRDPEAQANEETILQRYERFNGYENNSTRVLQTGTPSPPRPSPIRRTSTRTSPSRPSRATSNTRYPSAHKIWANSTSEATTSRIRLSRSSRRLTIKTAPSVGTSLRFRFGNSTTASAASPISGRSASFACS